MADFQTGPTSVLIHTLKPPSPARANAVLVIVAFFQEVTLKPNARSSLAAVSLVRLANHCDCDIPASTDLISYHNLIATLSV
jgi:hypothetical protein